MWQNLLRTATLSISSADGSFPAKWMLDPMKSMVWRSKLGWTVVAGFNDKLDFNLGGVLVATIAAGYYQTGAALAAVVETALTTAYATGKWTVTYDTATFKFTILHSITAHVLLNLTGANIASTILTDLGFSDAADSSSAITHTSDYTSYQSRHFVTFDLGAASLITAVGAIGLQSLTSLGSVRLEANTAGTVAGFQSPAYSATKVAADFYDDGLIHYLSQTYRYWRIVLDDPSKTSGYQQIGLPYIGGYFDLSVPPERATMGHGQDRFSRSSVGDAGSVFVDVRPTGKTRNIPMKLLTDVDKANLETMQKTIDQRAQFFAFDPVNVPAQFLYASVVVGDFVHHMGGGPSSAYWDGNITVTERLQ